MQLKNEQRVLKFGVVLFCILFLLLSASFFQGTYSPNSEIPFPWSGCLLAGLHTPIVF